MSRFGIGVLTVVVGLSCLLGCAGSQTPSAGAPVAGTLDGDRELCERYWHQGNTLRAERQSEPALEAYSAALERASAHEAELAESIVNISLAQAEVLCGLMRCAEARATLERAREVAARQPSAAELSGRITVAFAAATYGSDGYKPLEPGLKPKELAAAKRPAPAATLIVSAGQSAAPRRGSEAPHTVLELRSDFRECYRAALASEPDLHGQVTLVLRLASTGHVADVKAEDSELPRPIVDCLLDRSVAAVFEPPVGGATLLRIPVKLVRQD